jgi:hypothetical protein
MLKFQTRVLTFVGSDLARIVPIGLGQTFTNEMTWMAEQDGELLPRLHTSVAQI